MKKAVLLLNMGGPNNLSEVKTFLSNMFNDKAIISVPSFIRKFIAMYIVKKRLDIAKDNYKLIGSKSPIVGYTKELVAKLQSKLNSDVFFIMRYTPPFAKDVLLKIKDYDKFYLVPLYPHFSSTTTKSSFDDVFSVAKSLHIDKDKFVTIDRYYDNQIYNATIANEIKKALGKDDPKEFELIFSAHGLPQKIIDKGDPYMKHIKQNVFLARKELQKNGIYFFNTHLAYQSRLGKMPWIKPYLEDKLKSLKKKKVIIYPIAFLVDNSETKYELDIQYRDIAKKLGFVDYRVASAPNSDISDTIIDIIGDL